MLSLPSRTHGRRHSIALHEGKISRHKKSAAGWVCIRPQVLGVPPGGKGLASLEAMYVAPFIVAAAYRGNNAKELRTYIFSKSFIFNALVRFTGTQILEFFVPPARPINRRPVDLIAFPYAKGHRQLRLRKIARPSAHRPALHLSVIKNLDHRPHRIAIRFCSLQAEADATVPRGLIVAVQECRPVI